MNLRSERIEMRPVGPRDAEALLSVFRDPEVRRYLLDDSLVSLEWVRNEIASSDARFAASGAALWAIRLIGASDIIGFVGFRDFFDPPRLQLLYGLLPAFWGQGLATEAARHICDHAFSRLGFARIEAATDAPNEQSIAVLERLDMSLLKTSDEGLHGTVFYGIERERWRSARVPSGTDTDEYG